MVKWVHRLVGPHCRPWNLEGFLTVSHSVIQVVLVELHSGVLLTSRQIDLFFQRFDFGTHKGARGSICWGKCTLLAWYGGQPPWKQPFASEDLGGLFLAIVVIWI